MNFVKKMVLLSLSLIVVFGAIPCTVFAEEKPVSVVGEEIEIFDWSQLLEAVNELDEGSILNAKIMESLNADSKLDINEKQVNIYTDKEGIEINRTLKSDPNSTDPIFDLTNGAILTIGEEGKEITYLDSIRRENSIGLFKVNTGTTLHLSNAKFEDLNFGKSISSSGNGAIYSNGATVNLTNVTMSDCVGDNGVFIYINNSKVNMENCKVTNARYWGNFNSIGGVIQVKGNNSNVTMNNCQITKSGSNEKNQAAACPGAIYLMGGTVNIMNSTISENTAMVGAGIHAENTNLSLNGVDIINNICKGDGYNSATGEPDKNLGNITWWQGAGLYIENCILNMEKTNITGNTGAFIGGGMYITGTDLTLDDTVNISGNSAVCGGGIYTDDKDRTIAINGATISNNKTLSKTAYSRYDGIYNGCGAGIANDGGNVIVSSATISGNIAGEMGGAFLNYGTLTVNGGEIKGNVANSDSQYKGSAVLQAGSFNLSGIPIIEGDIFLTSGCVIDIPNAYTGKTVLVDIEQGDDVGEHEDEYDDTYQEGRNVAVYVDSLDIPTSTQKKQFVLADRVKEDGYFLRNEEKANDGKTVNCRILELFKPTNDYTVTYEFVGTNNEEVPAEVQAYCPVDANKYAFGSTVNVKALETTKVTVDDGVWTFNGWNQETFENISEDVTFIGKWKFARNASVINKVPTINAEDKPSGSNEQSGAPKTSDMSNVGQFASMFAGSAAVLAVLLGKRRRRK